MSRTYPNHQEHTIERASNTIQVDSRVAGISAHYETMPSAFVSTLLAASYVAYATVDITPRAVWLTWLLAMYVQVSMRLACWLVVRHTGITQCNHRCWGHVAVVGAFVSGLLWGGAVYWLCPDGTAIADNHHWMVAIVVCVLATTSAFASSTYPPAFFAFYLPIMLPLMLHMLHMPDQQSKKFRLVAGILCTSVHCFLCPYVSIFFGSAVTG